MLLTMDTVEEVPLEHIPLLRVITQIRFSEMPALSSDENGARLAASLAMYPVGRTVQGLSIVFTQGSAEPATERQSIRQFLSADSHWTVGVAKDFISLETDAYISRDDLCRRLSDVVASITEIAQPPVIDRIGVRYVDRWSDREFLESIQELLVPEILGVYPAVTAGGAVQIEHTIGNHRILLDSGGAIQFRSGYVPAGVSIDQAAPAIDSASWLLDIDVFQEWAPAIAFDADVVDTRVRQFADHAHSLFRWATTEEFIKRYRKVGGQ